MFMMDEDMQHPPQNFYYNNNNLGPIYDETGYYQNPNNVNNSSRIQQQRQ